MPDIESSLFLPLSHQKLTQILSEESLDFVHPPLTTEEYTAVYFITRLPDLLKSGSIRADHHFSEAVQLSNTFIKESNDEEFKKYIQSKVTTRLLREGLTLFGDFSISLLSDAIRPTTHWDHKFNEIQKRNLQRKSKTIRLNNGSTIDLIPEQTQITLEMLSENSEHMYLRAVAGSGKTTMSVFLLEEMMKTSARPLVLADSKNQIMALAQRLNKNAKCRFMTFGEIATQMIPADQTNREHRNFRRTDRSIETTPDNQLIKALLVDEVGNTSQIQIIEIVRSTMMRFCKSSDDIISTQHIPNRFKKNLDTVTLEVIREHTTNLWNLFKTSNSGRGLKPQVRSLHQIKWVALNRYKIPNEFTHVVIDESHSLTDAMWQIVNNSPQLKITLGDPNQNPHRAPVSLPIDSHIRELHISRRAGIEQEQLANSAISLRSDNWNPIFTGHAQSKTITTYYDGRKIPDKKCVLLVSDYWGLFEWSIVLADKYSSVCLLSDKKRLNKFVSDCIDLQRYGIKPGHPELFRFSKWEEAEEKLYKHNGFNQINKLLNKTKHNKRYDYTNNWANTAIKLKDKFNDKCDVTLALVKDVANMEFETVMLSADMYHGFNEEEMRKYGSGIYIGATRPTRQLLAPVRLRNWVENQMALK